MYWELGAWSRAEGIRRRARTRRSEAAGMPPYNELRRRLASLLLPDTKSQNWDVANGMDAGWKNVEKKEKQLRQNAKTQRALIIASWMGRSAL